MLVNGTASMRPGSTERSAHATSYRSGPWRTSCLSRVKALIVFLNELLEKLHFAGVDYDYVLPEMGIR